VTLGDDEVTLGDDEVTLGDDEVTLGDDTCEFHFTDRVGHTLTIPIIRLNFAVFFRKLPKYVTITDVSRRRL